MENGRILFDFYDMLPDACGCKDKNSVFMYANREYAKIVGVPNHQDIIGRTDFDMPCETSRFADIFREQDQKVMDSLKSMRILDVHPFAGNEWKAYLFTKIPLFDSKNQCIGTIFHRQNISDPTTLKIAHLLSRLSEEPVSKSLPTQNSYLLSSDFNAITLSKRQSEVLFYTLRGKTSKQIGKFLSISPRTIDEYLDILKLKFNASNKSDLIDCAIAQGYLNVIPEGLLRQQLSVELED